MEGVKIACSVRIGVLMGRSEAFCLQQGEIAHVRWLSPSLSVALVLSLILLRVVNPS